MKQNILLLLAVLAGGLTYAQEEADTTRIKIGGKQIIIIGGDTTITDMEDEDDDYNHNYDGDDLTYWSGFEVGINSPVNGDFKTNFESEHLVIDPSQSFVFNFNILEKRIRIAKDYFGIVTGLGFTNSRYGFKNESLRLTTTNDTTLGVADTNLFSRFSKNQLRVNTLNIPLLFQINTSKNSEKNFHLAFGVIGGVRIGSNIKYKYEVAGGGEVRSKEKGRYNLNAFNFSGTVRMGYNDVGLFANYNFIPLFEEDKSEIAYPLSFGVSLHF